MGYSDDYFELKKKRQKEEEEKRGVRTYSSSSNDIAPVRQTTATETKQSSGWFQKGAYADKNKKNKLLKTAGGTVADVAEDSIKGGGNFLERLWDGLMMMGAAANQGTMTEAANNEIMYNALTGKEEPATSTLQRYQEYQDQVEAETLEYVGKNVIDEEAIAKAIVTDNVAKIGIDVEEDSILGQKSDAIVQSGTDVLIRQGISKIPVVGQALSYAITGLTVMGGEAENAAREGASYEDAFLSGVMSAGAEIGSEAMFGGIKIGNKAWFDKVVGKVVSKIPSKFLATLTKWGFNTAGEGVEEVISGWLSAAGQKVTYKNEEELSELYTRGDAWDDFVSGAVLGGLFEGVNVGVAKKNNIDYITGLTTSEKKVIDKVYNEAVAEAEKKGKHLSSSEKTKIFDKIVADAEKGYISTDTIEEVLGGDDYKAYKKANDFTNALSNRANELGSKTQPTLAEQYEFSNLVKRIDESKAKTSEARAKLDETLSPLLKNSRLAESYNQQAKRKEAFKADLSQYDEKYQATIKKAVESGILNDTRKTHDFVDLIAKISADKGVNFDFTNNERLKNSSFAVEGKVVNGYVDKATNTIGLNIESNKALEKTVGHEITHILEGTDLYDTFQEAAFEYAKSKKATNSEFANEYLERLYNARQLYKDIEGYQGAEGFAEIKKEVVADLVGDYIFTDEAFVRNLSTKNRNVFEKIYDEIKYLCKVATAGSAEARRLEKVKKTFDTIYRESVSSKAESGEVKHSLSGVNKDGIEVYETSEDTMGLTWDERKAKYLDVMKNKYQGRTARFERNGHIYYAEFDQSSINKHIYGDDRSSPKGRKALIKAGADGDVFDLVENSQYSGSSPNKKNHTKADYFDYFVKTVQIDGKVFDLIADVEKNNNVDGGYVYTLALRDNKTIKASPAIETTKEVSTENAGNTFDEDIIPQNTKKSSGNTQFSLSNEVEETKNLIALHNLTESKLGKVMDLGGFPMPSIAVTRTDIPHTNFGDITLVMNKSTIDPKANRKNTVYSADAWTPTVPRTEYKPNDSRLREISNKIDGLVGDRNIRNALDYVAFDSDNVSRDLDQTDGNLASKYQNNNTLKYAFLKDKGVDIELPTKEAALSRGVSNDAVRYFSGKLVNGLQTVEHYQNMSATEMMNDKELTNAVAEALNWDILRQFEEGTENYEKLKENPVYKADELSYSQIDGLLSGARRYSNHGIEQTVDGREAKNTISNYFNENNLQEQYGTWLNELFDGVVEKTGIYNNKDIFTPSGNRRTFEQLHLPVTLDNIVKAMASQNDGNTKNVAGFNGVKTLRAGMAERFKSIDDMHKLEGRLKNLTSEEFDAIHDQLSERMYKVINSILETAPESSGNVYMRMDSIGETLMEIAESGNYDTNAIINTVNQYIYNIDESIAEEIRTLLYDVSQMPTNMFEAKPERAVGFDEVNAAILPDNADNALRERLEGMGVKVLTYEKGNDTDRLNKLNSLLEEQPDWKFSVSEQTEHPTKQPNLTYGDDIKLDIAPIREDVAKNATTTSEVPMPTDADAPPEMGVEYYNMPDTTPLDEKALKDISKTLRETLSLTAEETKAIQEVVQKYSASEMPSREELFEEIKEKFGEKSWVERNEDIAEVKRRLRSSRLKVSDIIKKEVAYKNETWSKFRKNYSGKLRFSQDGVPVDIAYMELSSEYPAFFPEDIANESDQLFRIAQVADMSIKEYYSQPLDDDTIQEAVNIVSDEVRKYKENTARMAAEEYSKDALDSVAPAKATQLTNGTRGDALLVQSLDNFPIKTVEDRVKEKIRAVEGELADNQQLRREMEKQFNDEIARLSNEYLSKKNPNTKVSANLLQRISNLQQRRASVDASFAKKISDLEARVEKMNTEKYQRAMHKQDKMQGYADWAKNLLGDTSTWKDKKLGLQYATNTEHRNLRDIVRDADGNRDIAKADAINDALSGQYNREQAEKNRELTKIRQKYADLKITNAESEYIQMLGEFRHNPDTTLTEKVVNEYYEKHKNKIDKDKVDKVIDLARQDYDSFFERLNAKLREQGMKEIPYRKGYWPHHTDPKQNFIQKLFNWKVQDNEIPTSIAGLTEDFKPVKSWQSFDKTRHSDTTDYNFLKGFDAYADGALDWIYHLETLQKRRAVENYIRYTHSDEGIQARIKEVYANEELDADEAQAQIEHILAEAKNPLNNFVQDFMTHTNILAGKKNSLDRTVEQATNRNIYSVMTNVQNRVSANMVLANVRSALTNFIPITQSWAQVSPLRSLQATKDTIANAIKDDGLINKSTFLTNRLREADNLYKTNWDKVLDTAGIMFEVVDNFSSQVIWRSKYNQNLARGMSESEAIKNADQFAENVMAGRSKGNEPTLFNAKNPLVKAFTMFQLEVNNQYGYLFKDVPTDLKAETNHWKLNLAKGYTTAFIGAYVYNALMSELTGSGAALDPIGIIEDLLRDLGLFDDDEEKEPSEVITNLVENVGGELPFVNTIFGGGRIPISSAVPYSGEGLVQGVGNFAEDIGEGDWQNIGAEMMNPVLNVGLPVGGNQLKKTVQGLKMFSDDHPVAGSYTNSGDLRFPVDNTLGNKIKAGVFGQWANENAQNYIENNRKPLNSEQIEEYMDVELPIGDYWKYRDGLKGLKKNSEKADYINNLDIMDWQKNVLMNNILDRKEDVDMSNYDDYNNWEEFDYASKNPEKYAFAKSVGGYSSYTTYSDALNDIKADKDASGKSITGSRKAKVLDYINSLDATYEAKIILWKSEYPSDDTYNAEIINYINSRNDLTYEEKVSVYKELGFTVSNGYVSWD